MSIGFVKKPQQIKSPHIKQTHTKRRIKLKEKRERAERKMSRRREKEKTYPPNEVCSMSMETEPLNWIHPLAVSDKGKGGRPSREGR
jgi:hypothetical protein